MTLVLIQSNFFTQISRLAIDANPDKTILQQLLKFFLKFALLSSDEGSEKIDFCIFRKSEDMIHHHIDGLGFDFFSALIAMRDTDSGEKEPQIIIDLGDGPHRRAGILAGCALFNGNGR